MEPETLYGREATHFRLRFILANASLDGQRVLALADFFLERLVFPGSPPVSIWTKRPHMNASLGISTFSDKKWNAARNRIAANQSSVLRLEARTTDFPNQTIAFSVHANPPGGNEHLAASDIELICSVPYLRHLAASREKTAALLELGMRVWETAKPVYGFGNVANIPKRPGLPFALGGPPQLDVTAPPADRVHDIPVAQTGNDIDGNIDGLIANGRGIKGAYWANFLGANHVEMAGGVERLTNKLSGLRMERLAGGGLLIVATDAPLPQDSDDNRARFRRLEAALRPAFLSRAETPANKRALLGEFYRERV